MVMTVPPAFRELYGGVEHLDLGALGVLAIASQGPDFTTDPKNGQSLFMLELTVSEPGCKPLPNWAAGELTPKPRDTDAGVRLTGSDSDSSAGCYLIHTRSICPLTE